MSDTIFDRVLMALGIDEKRGWQAELARKLNVKSSTVSGWKTRGVPEKIVANVAIISGVAKKWIETGQGQKRPLSHQITDEEREKWRREGHSQAREGPGVFIAANATEAYLFSRIQTADHKTIHKLLEIFLDEEAKPEGSHKNGTEG